MTCTQESKATLEHCSSKDRNGTNGGCRAMSEESRSRWMLLSRAGGSWTVCAPAFIIIPNSIFRNPNSTFRISPSLPLHSRFSISTIPILRFVSRLQILETTSESLGKMRIFSSARLRFQQEFRAESPDFSRPEAPPRGSPRVLRRPTLILTLTSNSGVLPDAAEAVLPEVQRPRPQHADAPGR